MATPLRADKAFDAKERVIVPISTAAKTAVPPRLD
jgi:hypothetical protein